MRRMLFVVLLCCTLVQANTIGENVSCSFSPSPSIELKIANLPVGFELGVPYTVFLSSNDPLLLSFATLEISAVSDSLNESTCVADNATASSLPYKAEFVLKLEKNSTQTPCVQLNLRSFIDPTEFKVANLCTNNTADKLVDNDDKYDVQSYVRTVNTSEIALLDNFNWLIFGSRAQQIWYTHEGMRLSRECDAAEDGRVAFFNNPRGKRRLISRPIDVTNVSLLYMRLGSGTCPPPGPTDPPFQLLMTADCLNYSNWRVIYSQPILPGIEHLTVPLADSNLTNASTVCLKIEQSGEKFAGGGSWFIDDLLLLRARLQNTYFSETFQSMRLGHWQRLAGGQLKTCDDRMSMVFEANPDIHTEIGATTIDLSLPGTIDAERDVLFHLSKNNTVDWTKWSATGFSDLNKTCADEDVITFNGENYRQLCSPTIELGQIDSVRVTLSTEPCLKRNKHVPTPGAVIFLAVFYNGSTAGYSRIIRRIALREIQQSHKTFHSRLDEFRHGTTTFGRLCLSQYHQSAGKNADVWSVREFVASPLLQSNITHYMQLGLNTNCALQSQATGDGAIASSQSVNVDYSVDFGKIWHRLLQPCFLDSSCPPNVQHVYSSKIVLSSTGWHRVTLPLPIAALQHEYTRFRISTAPSDISTYSASDSWAIDRVFLGQCFRGCSDHGWCQGNACRCDAGFSGDFCERSNGTLASRVSFLMDSMEDQTESLTHQGGRLSYQCDIVSRGKALVFSRAGARFLRISNINGSSPRLLEFTLRLGSSSAQCSGTSKTDLDRDFKSILLLSSCSNGVHWSIVDRFSVSDILAPNFGTMNRILFHDKPHSENCLVEWRQMTHGGDNQDVWAIDDISIGDVISAKSVKRTSNVKTFQTKVTYIRPGYVFGFRLQPVNQKQLVTPFDLDDIRLRVNSSTLDLSKDVELFSYHSVNGTVTLVITLPRSLWFKDILLNVTVTATRKFDLHFVHLGVQCENNCWLNGVCYEGICWDGLQKLPDSSTTFSFDENDLASRTLNAVDDEVLLPLTDAADVSAVHFQTVATNTKKNSLLCQCSPNGGVKWFEVGTWPQEKHTSIKDHYAVVPSSCQFKRTLFRWRNASIQILNVALVQQRTQYHFMDQFERMDSSKWLYPTYMTNASALHANPVYAGSLNRTTYQLTSTLVTLKQADYVIMIDTEVNQNNASLQVSYTLDNTTWHELLDTRSIQRKMNRFGRSMPAELARRSILIRIGSESAFTLNYIYIGPPCPANCYGHGKCLWKGQKATCQCDQDETSENNCLPTDRLLSSIYETFTSKLNASKWSSSADAQVAHRCHNRQSTTTPYLCFSPSNRTQRSYATIGPFEKIKGDIGVRKFRSTVLFGGIRITAGDGTPVDLYFQIRNIQYSFDNGIQWFTRAVLDASRNFFENFDDVKINQNLHLRWIEENDQPCLTWNLRSVSIRTAENDSVWFDNNLNAESKGKIDYEAQTWELPAIQPSSQIQFELQMFPVKKTNDTHWQLTLEISSDPMHGWSNWIPLIPSCNQTTLYCQDRIALTGSIFLAELYQRPRNVTIPIPDSFVNQEVRFRWSTSRADARFMVKHLYVGADCPWFCSGHGTCKATGCLCDPGYVLPYCAPDPSSTATGDGSPARLNASLSAWSEAWGYEKCSPSDERYVFAQTGTRGLVSSEFSLIDVKLVRIQLDTCFNRTDTFLDPVHVQISTNNGVLWQSLMSIVYRPEAPRRPWLIDLPGDDVMQRQLVRIRLFQRTASKWTSNWILEQFEIIPRTLPNRWFGNHASPATACNYKNYLFPVEVYSTADVQLNETSFLTFQLDRRACVANFSETPDRCDFNLELSTDYGRTWLSIARPSMIASKSNDVIINQPLRAIKSRFYLPINAYYPLFKFIRIRWLAENATAASRWQVVNVTVGSECDLLCELETCNGKCQCSARNNCSVSSTKTTFFERFNDSSPPPSDVIQLPPLNLISTRFLELDVHASCDQASSAISLEFSRNMGLSWHLLQYYILSPNQSHVLHEEFLDEMKYDFVLIRLQLPESTPQCLEIEQIIVSGSNLPSEVLYAKFDRLGNLALNRFVSFGDGVFNGTYLLFPSIDQSSTTGNAIITDDMVVLDQTFYIQLALAPLALHQCINVRFSVSADNGRIWQAIDHQDSALYIISQARQAKIYTWKFASMAIGSNQVRFRIRFDGEQSSPSSEEQLLVAVSELYIGSACTNGCNGRGMCSNHSRCRCEPGWANGDCSLSLHRFPNELDILKHGYFKSDRRTPHAKCGAVFDNICKRELETNYLDIHREHTYTHIELEDQCVSKTAGWKHGDGWIRLQYREANAQQWTTLHTFKVHEMKITKLLPISVVQLRLIQDPPFNNRSAWSVEQFHVFHIHSSLQWPANGDKNRTVWNSTFLTWTKSATYAVYETKDVHTNLDQILQLEYTCLTSTVHDFEYSADLGAQWLEISTDNTWYLEPIPFTVANVTFARLTIPLRLLTNRGSTIRLRLRFSSKCPENHLQYLYVGSKCPMNCFGNGRCKHGECEPNQSIVPLVDFRETFERDFSHANWLHLEPYQQEANRIRWTTKSRQAITQPIDLRSIRAIKWTYTFGHIAKACQSVIYLLLSTDGASTWSLIHQFEFTAKQTNNSAELTVDLASAHTKYQIGQLRWYEPESSKCVNSTWGLSKIISIKSINIYFLTDYFYAASSSRPNWESIEGASLAQPDMCNNNLPVLVFREPAFSVTTVPILIQSHYVLVFQFNTECDRNTNAKVLRCRNMTSEIEYQTETTAAWIKLADMADLTCRTSLLNGGYFSMHTIKLPFETYSSGTQFRWIGTQLEGERWSLNSLFVGECPAYCHDRGVCTVSGCQCAIDYAGTHCEKYVGKEPLPTGFNETFDDPTGASVNAPNLNNWMKLSGDGQIRHVCEGNAKNNTTKHLRGQALHFNAGCGCGNGEAITRELNITQATTISFAFHVTTEDNCLTTTNNVTVALEWTNDEGISWTGLVTLFNQKRTQLVNMTLPAAMKQINRKRTVGGVRFRWTQTAPATNDIYWALDNIRLE